MEKILDYFENFKKSIDEMPGEKTIELSQVLLEFNKDVRDSISKYFLGKPLIVKDFNEIRNDINILQELPINIDYLKCNFVDEWAVEAGMSQGDFSANRYHYLFAEKKGSPPIHNTYVYSALESGYLNAVSPYSGKLLKTSLSFPIMIDETWTQIIFYRFEEVEREETFYIGTAGYPSIKSFIFFPRHNLVIVWPLYLRLGYKREQLSNAVNELYRKFLVFCEPTIEYLKCYNRQSTLAVGMQFNLGHFFTNEYAGLFRVVKTGLYRKVKNILTHKHVKIKLKKLFAEFQGIKTYECIEEDEIYFETVKNKLFVIYPCASYLCAEAAFHIREISRQYISNEQKRLIERCSSEPLLFINLRKHNKAWKEQVGGIIELARTMKHNYPRVGIVLDGFNDCQEDMDKISLELKDEVQVYNGIGMSLFDTIGWACRADAYLCVVGAGLIILTCIANKPGIAHAEHSHLGQILPGGYWSGLRNDMLPPIPVACNEIIVDIQDNSNMPTYENYSMNWKSLYNRLTILLGPINY